MIQALVGTNCPKSLPSCPHEMLTLFCIRWMSLAITVPFLHFQFFIFHSSLLSLDTKCMNVKIQGMVLYWEFCHTAVKKAGPCVCVCGWI